MFRRFLVPLDGSKESEQIVDWVAGIAEGLGSEVTLLTVIDPSDLPTTGIVEPVQDTASGLPGASAGTAVYPPVAAGGAPIVDRSRLRTQIAEAQSPAADGGEQFYRRVTEDANHYLRTVGRRFEEKGVNVATEVASGKPAEVIADFASRVDADVIALATKRESAIARGVLGSVTDRVVHSTDLPTLVIQPKDQDSPAAGMSGPGTIIVPLDGSELSESAVPYALEIARALKARLVFLRAAGLPYAPTYAPYTTYAALEYEQQVQTDAVSAQGNDYLEKFVEQARAAGLEAESRLYSGGAAHRIIDEAEERPDSMVIMTTHGRTGIRRWFLGSVTDKVVRSSGQPVLVLPSTLAGVQE